MSIIYKCFKFDAINLQEKKQLKLHNSELQFYILFSLEIIILV